MLVPKMRPKPIGAVCINLKVVRIKNKPKQRTSTSGNVHVNFILIEEIFLFSISFHFIFLRIQGTLQKPTMGFDGSIYGNHFILIHCTQ